MMKRKNILMIIMALVLVVALAACGPKTEDAVNDDMEKAGDTMETAVPHDDDSSSETDDNDSAEHEDSDDDSGDNEDNDSDDQTEGDDGMTEDTDKVFTTEELALYDGKDGQPAYIAVDGIVYDVTDVSAWRSGNHQGFEAGKDVTDQIGDISPHGVRVLDNLPKVGTLKD